MQYSTEKPADTLTVTIYGNKDASFTLYEDENYNYEKQKYSTITFAYTAATKLFTLSAPIGKFEGMINNRVFKIVFVGNNVSTLSRMVNYTGEKIKIKI